MKSLDVSAKTYINDPGAILKQVQGYLDKINKFERGRSLKELHVDDIDRKELVICIEKNKTTAAQR